jgi:hypothetical protein
MPTSATQRTVVLSILSMLQQGAETRSCMSGATVSVKL